MDILSDLDLAGNGEHGSSVEPRATSQVRQKKRLTEIQQFYESNQKQLETIWTFDSYREGYYIISPRKNPRGALLQISQKPKEGEPDSLFLAERSASRKVVRGGAWETTAFMLRSSSRKVFYPGYRIEGVGFRCVTDLN